MYTVLTAWLVLAYFQRAISAPDQGPHFNDQTMNETTTKMPEANSTENMESDNVDYNEEIQARTEAIKLEILRQLGLKQVPKISKSAALKTEKMYQISKMLSPQNDAPVSAMVQTLSPQVTNIISNLRNPPAWWGLGENSSLSLFKFDSEATVHNVKNARLWIFVKPLNVPRHSKVTLNITVSQVKNLILGGPIMLREIETKKLVITEGKGAWLDFEVTKLVSYWFRYPWKNLGLSITARLNEERVLLDLDENSPQQSFISVTPASKDTRRRKRTSEPVCHDSTNKTRCCLHPLTINFTKLGWDFVAEPKSFEANFCKGECSPPYSIAHTKLVKDMRQNKDTSVCCVPLSLSSITMHYRSSEDGNLYVATIKQVVANDCRCF